LKGATKDVLIVDPYMDERAVTDFAVLAPGKGVTVRLLAPMATRKPAKRHRLRPYNAGAASTLTVP